MAAGAVEEVAGAIVSDFDTLVMHDLE